MPYDANGNSISMDEYTKQFGSGSDMGSYLGAQIRNQKGAAYAANDAQAAQEASQYETQANQDAANKTNALAQTLAQARNYTPGGGIRMGIQAPGFNANSTGSGLVSANAAKRLATRKAQLRSQTDQQITQNQSTVGPGYSTGFGDAIQLW